ncbi:MAG TPA: hypothetical protein VHQ43_01570 [Solirubrobacterales bacterium]|nr:hypothetical protein [Solirubrobacterales bacterium]
MAIPSQAATAFGKTPAQQLVDAYAPRVVIREQGDPPCETSAEQYEATTVGTVRRPKPERLLGQSWERIKPAKPTATVTIIPPQSWKTIR